MGNTKEDPSYQKDQNLDEEFNDEENEEEIEEEVDDDVNSNYDEKEEYISKSNKKISFIFHV